MTWIDVITTAEILLLCAIAYGVYRVKQAIEDMYSGLGRLLGQHREIAGKILFQLDSSDVVPPRGVRGPLDVEVRTIREDLRSFMWRWVEIHTDDFARTEMEEFKRQKSFRKQGESYGREEKEREAKTKDAPENGDT